MRERERERMREREREREIEGLAEEGLSRSPPCRSPTCADAKGLAEARPLPKSGLAEEGLAAVQLVQ